MSVEVKICGLTRPEDAATAAGAGAAYLGAVFAGGPRQVDVGLAREIVAAAPGVPVLGVFGDQDAATIERTCRAGGLAGAQLHGAHHRRDAARLRASGLLVWRVVRVAVPTELALVTEAVAEADAVLVEPRVAGARGGAGVPLALGLAQRARALLGGHRMVLAGGLTASTVGAAAALVGPEVVDVSSGVEQAPGIKDPHEIIRFVEAALGQHPVP